MKKLIAFVACMAAALGLSSMPGLAHAQSPSKMLRIIVPFQPGGMQDVIARHLSSELGARFGTTVIVENKAGASGTMAADAVSRMPPDGTTLMITTGGAISIAPHLRPNLPYDPAKDFVAVAMVADMPMALAVRADSPLKTMADVVREAKRRPGQLTVGNTGVGSISHLSAELFAQALNIKLLHVPYKGVGSVQDLVGGQIEMIMTSSVSTEDLVKSKKVRVLGTFSKQRLPSAGGAPTVSEAMGIEGLEFPVWVGILAPAGTEPAQLKRLSTEILAICNAAPMRAQLKEIVACADSNALESILREDRQRWGEIIRKANIKAQ